MKVIILPNSKIGKWTVWLILLFFKFLAIFFFFVFIGERGGETIFSNLYLTIPFLIAIFSAISSFFTGLLSIFQKGDHCIAIYLSIIIGLFVLIFILGELIFPH